MKSLWCRRFGHRWLIATAAEQRTRNLDPDERVCKRCGSVNPTLAGLQRRHAEGNVRFFEAMSALGATLSGRANK